MGLFAHEPAEGSSGEGGSMNRGALIKLVESRYVRTDLPEFRPGDTVRVSYKVKEGNRTRIQDFEGIVIRIRRNGFNTTFTVRKVSYGVGVERIFPLHSPSSRRLTSSSGAGRAGPSSTSSATSPTGRSAASSGPTGSGLTRTGPPSGPPRRRPRRPRSPRLPRSKGSAGWGRLGRPLRLREGSPKTGPGRGPPPGCGPPAWRRGFPGGSAPSPGRGEGPGRSPWWKGPRPGGGAPLLPAG